VNAFFGLTDDDQTQNTTGSAKYPGMSSAPVKAPVNASEAQLRAQQMADAMNWLHNKEATGETTATTGNVDDDELGWWSDDR
jgi:hypothetical protein